jgi:sulfoxide reductase heme-binding subunit YedZ
LPASEAPAPRNTFARRRAVLFVLALIPLISLANDYEAGSMARPWATMINVTGDWSMRFLIAGLCVTPLGRLTGQFGLVAFRRMIGLFGAFYAALHLFAWCREYGYDWSFLGSELVLRHYLTIGAVAALLLVPLAATSPGAMHRVLGPTPWRRLHTLIYPAVLAAFVHYAMARGLRAEVTVDGLLLVVVFTTRLAPVLRPVPAR